MIRRNLILIQRFVFENTEIEVVNIGDTLHILDLDIEGTKSLTNAAGDAYFKQIKKHFRNSINHLYLYHTDGIITEWKRGRFCYVSFEDPAVYEPYKDVSLSKRRAWAI